MKRCGFSIRAAGCAFAFCISFAIVSIPVYSQTQPTPASAPTTEKSSTAETSAPQAASISGTVVDKDGAVIPNAKLTLTQPGLITPREAISGADGSFTFANVNPGSFQLTLTASGFASQQASGTLQPGQAYVLPQIEMEVGLATVDVEVSVKQEIEIAEQQIHIEEHQRIFGAIPNYFVSYIPNAVPLTRRQKFELAWKSSFDPFSFGIAGAIAGLEQATNTFPGYGHGMQGYGKRYGQTFADLTIGTYIGSALLPSLLKQDPRYFYKGTGSKKSRLLYALANAVICKGDNGKWQPNYSNVLGSLAAGGISNLYLSSADRNGARVTFENGLIGIAGTAAAAVAQEFFLRRITPHLPDPQSSGL